MGHSFTSIILYIIAVSLPALGASLLEQLNFLASQSQYSNEMFQAPFSLENIMGPSLDMAVQSCQNHFKLERWNCPSSDFFMRRTSKLEQIDKEDAYIYAVTTAAILYTISKNCSSGIVAGCGCIDSNTMISQCSDDPEHSEQIYGQYVGNIFPNDFSGSVSKHNYKTVTNLLRKSLVKQCSCRLMGATGCLDTVCWNVLRPFAEIAKDLHQMYEQSLQLNDAGVNAQVIWKNIPLDAFVYVKDSPNFCEPDAVPGWNGMRGRQCASVIDGEKTTAEDREKCLHLCRACGYAVRTKKVMKERRCNCKFTWGFQVHCDTCVNIEQQSYCY